MRKPLLLASLLLLLAIPAHAQLGNTYMKQFPGTPTGSCTPPQLGKNTVTGALYDCVAGVWTAAGGASSITPGANISVNSTYNVKNYGAVGDARSSKHCVIPGSGSTITNATDAPWVAGDVGKQIFFVGTNGATTSNLVDTITAVNSSSSITINGTSTGAFNPAFACVWFTQKDTSAFISAQTAAVAGSTTSSAFIPSYQSPTLGYPSNIYCPAGGYVVDGPIYTYAPTTNDAITPFFTGAGMGTCVIYLSPDFVGTSLIASTNSWGTTIGDFSIEGSNIVWFSQFTTNGVLLMSNAQFFVM